MFSFSFFFFFTYRNQRGILSAPSISCGSYRRKSREINTSEQCLCPKLFHNRGRNRNRRAGTTGFFFLNPFFFFSQFYGANSSWSADQKKAFFLVLYMFVVCVSFVSFIRRPRRFLCVFFSWAGLNGTTGTAHIYTRQDRTHIHTHILFHHQKIMKIEIYTIYTHKYRQPASGKRERERNDAHGWL